MSTVAEVGERLAKTYQSVHEIGAPIMPTTRIKRFRTVAELDAIEKVWTSLERVDGGPSIFQSWIWNRTWCEHVLNSRRRVRLDVRLVEDGAGRTLAILPFFEETLAGPLMRLTQFLGHRMSYHNDILLADPNSSELADEVIQALIDDLGCTTVLHLRHLDGQSTFTKQLLGRQVAEPQCPRVWVRADPIITDQHMRLGRSRRSTVRRAENRLRKHFNSEFRVRSGKDFSEAFDELVDLHQRRFDSMGRSTLLVGPNLVFLKAATSKLSHTGNFEIVQLRAGDRTIAAALMTRDKRRYFFVQGGFDPEFSRFSPMRILLTETMRRGFHDLECEIYDLGPGYEPYKFDWKPCVGTNYFCSLGGSGPYAKAMAALYGVAFRRRIKKAGLSAQG